MAEQQFSAVQNDNRILDSGAAAPRLHLIDDNTLESDIIELLLHTEQDIIPEGDVAETVSHTSTDSTLPLAAVGGRVVGLPIEVCERIIGFLDNWDVETIANCVLVCRQWVPFSRFKLYHCVRLKYRQQWTAFHRLILLSASPDMAVYLGKVQQLHIHSPDKISLDAEGVQRKIGWRKGQERPWTHLVLVECAARLPAITHILFHRMDWSEHYYAPGLRSGRDWHSLVTLQLYHCTFASVAQLHLFVTAFPALTDLTLDGVELKPKTTLHIPKGGHPLTRLELYGDNDDNMTTVIRWLVCAKLVQKLVDLDWWRVGTDQWNRLTEAIDGASLERLYLRNVPEELPVNLSRFTSLQVLKLDYGGWPFHQYFKSVSSILSSISSNQLQELDIELWHSSHDVSSLNTILDAFTQLKVIDDLLAGPRFTHLRHVALRYRAIEIHIQAIPDTSPSPSRGNIIPVSTRSGSQPDPSDQLVRAQLGKSLKSFPDDPQHLFKLYVEPLVQCKIRDEMKQLDARGILEIKVTVRTQEKE